MINFILRGLYVKETSLGYTGLCTKISANVIGDRVKTDSFHRFDRLMTQM